MSINIALRPEVEAWLQEEAARDGVTPGEAVARVIESQWSLGTPPPALRGEEFDKRIREDFSVEFWSQYRMLHQKIQDETSTEPERQEFLGLHTQVEAKNLERMRLLAQMALRRGVPLPDLMQELGVGPVQVPRVGK